MDGVTWMVRFWLVCPPAFSAVMFTEKVPVVEVRPWMRPVCSFMERPLGSPKAVMRLAGGLVVMVKVTAWFCGMIHWVGLVIVGGGGRMVRWSVVSEDAWELRAIMGME